MGYFPLLFQLLSKLKHRNLPMKLVNVGCGFTYHKDWINLDLKKSKFVRYHNIQEPLPFEDNSIDVIYHSHALEHLTKEEGKVFISECYRVLKNNGIMRVVIPDMEQIVREYLVNLEKGFYEYNQNAIKHYKWNKMELFDQMIRRKSGGEMYEMILEGMIDKEYVIKRNGDETLPLLEINQKSKENMFKSLVSSNPSNNPQTSGETHKWMYDKLDLKILLEKSRFKVFKIVKYNESQIPNWSEYKLDTSIYGDYPRKPDSLFVEAIKSCHTL